MMHKYDLEERTLRFSQKTAEFIGLLKNNTANYEFSKQLVRSASSVGANYIEANESLSKKDFLMRIKICIKEAKETTYWLRLINCEDNNNEQRLWLLDECQQINKILGAILMKCTETNPKYQVPNPK